MNNNIFNKRKIINYIIFFGTIFIFFYLNSLILNLKTANDMLNVSIQVDAFGEIFNDINVYRISPDNNVEKIDKYPEDKSFRINNNCYVKKIKIEIPKNNINKINNLEIKIGKKKYSFDKNFILNKYKTDNNKDTLTFNIDDFKGIKRSFISLFKNIINWQGDFKFFILRYLFFFLIILTIGIISYIVEIKIIEKYPLLLENKKIINIFYFIIVTCIFNMTYLQTYLYRFNQHTKFLHGLAKAGYGFLKNDWLAKTIDPLPVFSFLVFITYKFLHEYFFYFYYLIILGIFIYSIISISSNTFKINKFKISGIIFFTLVILLHSNLFHEYTLKYFNLSITNLLFKDGLADQYLLGEVFQPCVFGVFLLLSIYFFIINKQFISIIFLIIPSYFHTAYLYSSGVLTLSYLIIIYFEEKDIKKVIFYGLFSLIMILPIIFYYLVFLKSTSEESVKTAFNIMVNIRNPHHMVINRIISSISLIKILIIIIAIFIIRKSRLFLVILVPFIATLLIMILQIFLESDFIGFLTPWRVSVWMVPLSSSLIIAYIVSKCLDAVGNKIYKYKIDKIIMYLCLLIILFAFSFGLNILIIKFNDYLNIDHGKMLNYVRDHKSPDDTYLVPVEMANFRLDTGAPVFITYKSHPYKDVEVLEWYYRINKAEEFYENNEENKCILLEDLKKEYKITHVVLKKDLLNRDYNCLIEFYNDGEYGIYKIK